VLTLHAAARLLAAADSSSALHPIARALGFPEPPVPVTPEACSDLGIALLVSHAEIATGPGSFRLLLAVLAGDHEPTIDLREQTRRLATAVARRAPTREWCALLLDAAGRTLCIASVTAHGKGVRIAALRVDRERVVDSDADTLRALAAVTERHGSLRHARFTDLLRREALSARFYRELERIVGTLADTAAGTASALERRELALLCASRCLFLAFLEAKGWLDADRNFLLRHATTRLELGGRIHDRLLRPLFFGTLNTPGHDRSPAAREFGDVPFLNGGLFAPTALERVRRGFRFSDDALVALIGDLLDRYRFTAHEDSTSWSEAAVDPEMLGRAFESLMASDERRRSGSFYTPPPLVNETVRHALSATLPWLPSAWLSDDDATPLDLGPGARAELLAGIDALRVLDPACGSGAFLVHAMERVAALMARCGDARPLHELRRHVLTRSIFGVDCNPMAVWLCELRLWLSVVIECHGTRAGDIPPLPNLDHHIRIGDTLAGGDFRFAPAGSQRLHALRARYTRATGGRKVTLAESLDREERLRAVAEVQRRVDAVVHERRETLAGLRSRDLFGQRTPRAGLHGARLRVLRLQQRELLALSRKLQLGGALPFRFAAYFADVAAAGGFSMIVGNPPWVRPHALPVAQRDLLRAEFVAIRHAAWDAGARRAGAGAGFAAQADVSVAFVERATRLLAPGGTMALLVPAKLWRTLAGGGVRRFLCTSTALRAIHDWSDAPAMFDAAVYPSLVVAQRAPGSATVSASHPATLFPDGASLSAGSPTRDEAQCPAAVSVAVARGADTTHFCIARSRLSLDGDPSAPWIFLPPDARAAFDALRCAGPALGDSPLGRPTLGVKCGCNAAFLVHAVEQDDDSAIVSAAGRTGTIERCMLRPVLRGEEILVAGNDQQVRQGASHDGRIVWTHGPDGAPLRVLPPRAARWMSHWRRRLEARRDARARQRWWTLFRTDAARHDAPRLVWADIGRTLRSQVLLAGDPTVPLNSCYVLRTPSEVDAWALHGLLVSPVAGAWLDTIAEPARGGFRRFLGWTVAALPVPADWPRARNSLAEIGRGMARGTAAPDDILPVVARAYGVALRDLQPLLDWHAR
jgi:hypothetical protein